MNDVWRRSAPGMTLALLVLFPMSAAAQSDAEPWSLPRTAAGVPDLNGVWDFRTITPMERPDSLAGKAVLTDEEAASLEEQTARERVSTKRRRLARPEPTTASGSTTEPPWSTRGGRR